MTEALSQYNALLAKVDRLFSEIRGRHPGEFSCGLGCHSCCKPGLTINSLEAENIRRGLDPALVEKMQALETADPFQGMRCSFLESDGACGIYALRPLVCRSHGLPLQFKDLGEAEGEEAIFRDVCYLNFRHQDISGLPDQDVLNLDTLNTILAMLNRLGGGGEKRKELSLSSLISG